MIIFDFYYYFEKSAYSIRASKFTIRIQQY
jgi:hypothetical protein